MTQLIPAEVIERKIFLIRGHKVMLDSDLATLYGVSTSRLNEQVRRNAKRFPADFMFQLTREEFDILISHFATSRWGGTRKLPLAFTEQGVAIPNVRDAERHMNIELGIKEGYDRENTK